MRKILAILVLALGLLVWPGQVSQATPMGTAFAYQGLLYDVNSPADGLYDFQFKLYDANSDANQIGIDLNKPDVDVIDGSFTVKLDFASNVFDGNAVWLEIRVRPGDLNDPNVYTTLSPRQELTPTPYAMHSENADTLDSFDSAAFASSAHNHDGVYAPVAHSHDGVYALISHVHDDRYYTETELQSSGSASVHWDNLTNVPADIADGDDDTQLTEAQVDTYVSNNGYLDASSALDWDNITIDMPAGFADGVDDVGGGDLDWMVSDSNMYSIPSGNVGIGTTSPTHKLEVEGDAHVKGELTWQARTGYLSLPAANFRPMREGYSYQNNGYELIGNVTVKSIYFAGVQLPHRATVTKVTFYWRDYSSDTGTTYLYMSNFMGAAYEMATVDTTGTGGNGSSYDDTISYATIDNSQYAYYLRLLLPDGLVRAYGVVIEYTYTEPH
ncbi:MAG: hypothetical protein ACYS4W_12900 [Planctomycetota bacterium]